MAIKRNPGRFTHKIVLLKPKAKVRDELGGIAPIEYEQASEVFAMCEQKSQSRQQIIGDYVTQDTRYFVVLYVPGLYSGINTTWRIKYNGFVYNINQLEVLDESSPYYLQITATAINAGGSII